MGFGRTKEDWFSITTDEKFASSGPNTVFGEGAEFGYLIDGKDEVLGMDGMHTNET